MSKKASDDTSVVTAKTVETALTGSTIDGGDIADDVSVLTKNDDASAMDQIDEEKKGEDSEDEGEDEDEEGVESGEEEEGDESENDVGEEADNMSALTANTKATANSATTTKTTSSRTSLLSKLTPSFLKKSESDLPKVTSTRRFSVDGSALRRFSVFGKKQEDIGEIEPYLPAIKFHERMAKRRENFRTRKEIVADIVENAEHNDLKMEDDMKFMA
ncbi:hypothetical protein TrVE_jg11403 [Triparma verrucosa]|uniref:Uncharacterized protein n=1 Tax=Triparma verrucosa TaxID=1606542 RepID=A0A9W7FB52_9STRA|nr:hypothetical protein TrVE_jg11403 [Triparma verrucosa]